MFDNIFNISFPRFTGLLLPISLRKSKMLHWLFCLTQPVVSIYGEFIQYRNRSLYKLQHTPQVFSMENMLNDNFDQTQRRIYIRDGIYRLPVLFFDRADNKPVRFDDRPDNPVRFFDRESLSQLDVDFVVILPTGLNLSDPEMIRLKSLVDFYRLPDKTYNVIYE